MRLNDDASAATSVTNLRQLRRAHAANVEVREVRAALRRKINPGNNSYQKSAAKAAVEPAGGR